jgi:molybdopterin-guanine dinucleotide biosynthesis protein MobB
VGTSGVGKTTLLAKVVSRLKRLGLRVGVIKHTHHHTFEIDREGKDSRRLAEAGSDAVILSSYGNTALIRHRNEGLPLDELALMLEDTVDIILVEGYKDANAPKVLVHRSSVRSNLPIEPDLLLAIVSDQRLAMDIPQFTFDEVDPLVQFLIAFAHCADPKGPEGTPHSPALSRTRG